MIPYEFKVVEISVNIRRNHAVNGMISFKNIYFYFISISVLTVSVYVYYMNTYCPQKLAGVTDLLELEIQSVVTYHVHARNWTQVIYNNCKES